MGLDATVRRRCLGALMLLAAVIMLAAGETILKPKLHDVAFLVYWLVCLVLTGAAILVAYVDARVQQRRGKREARELLESTLNQIEKEAKTRSREQRRS